MFSILFFLLNSCIKKSLEGYIKVDQGQLYYQSFGKGDPIIVLHGGPGALDHNYLLPQMRELAKSHQVIFYDQRGSGKSFKAFHVNLITISQFTKDLEDIRKALSFRKFILIGHSWGGLLAMHCAIEHSDNVRLLVLCNSVPSTSNRFAMFEKNWIKKTAAIQSKLQKLKINSKSYLRLLFSVYCYSPKDAKKISLNCNQDAPEIGDQVMQIFSSTCLTKFYDIQNDLKRITCPTLIIHGDSDIVPVEGARNLHACIPHSKLVVIKNCGHFPYVEKAEEFFRVINLFASRLN